jgi:shikimate dehydrogenase
MKAPDRYAVVGHPIAHSRSPFIHARFAAQTGQHLDYGRLDIAPERLDSEVRAFFDGGGKGLNLSVPHKEAGARLVASLSDHARRAGAVNTLLRDAHGALHGENTDGVGLLRDLTQNLRLSLGGMRILLLGAGGAARGVVAPLLEQKPARLLIANRDVSRAERLAEVFASGTDDSQQGAGSCRVEAGGFAQAGTHSWDLILNATAASLTGELPQLADESLTANTFCYDMAYGDTHTVFVRWARERGARATMGLGMLVEQAAEAFWLWRGVRPETGPVLKALSDEGLL